MVEATLVDEQLKRIKFNAQSWNRAETIELAEIILPGEEIFECANGWYEGGFALIVATNFRVLLIDKKPFKYLKVEDIRFDMINEIDHSHRLFDARIHISTGPKALNFRSVNQQRLRKLINHVQHRMAEMKTEQSVQNSQQEAHLKQIDERLQTYLLAQFQQTQSFGRSIRENEKLKELSAQTNPFSGEQIDDSKSNLIWDGEAYKVQEATVNDGVSADELYEEGRKEIFKDNVTDDSSGKTTFSKLPAIFRHRLYGRTILKKVLVSSPEAAV